MTPNPNEIAHVKKYEKFFSIYFSVVKNYAWLLLRSEEDAEDIAQDVFAKLWIQPELWLELKGAALDKRLYVITKNTTLNFIKRRKLEQNYQEQVFQKHSLKDMLSLGDPMEDIYFREVQLIIKLVLDHSPLKRREIFMMSRYEGKSNNEIAEICHISVRTVEHQIYRVLLELKKTIFLVFFFIFCVSS